MKIEINSQDAMRLTGMSLSDAQEILRNRQKDRKITPSEVRELIVAQFIIALHNGNEKDAANALYTLLHECNHRLGYKKAN